MSGKSSSEKYTPVAIALHWMIGLAVLFMIWFGHYVHDLPREDPWRGTGFNIHESIGILILILMLARVWWRHKHPVPQPLPALKPWEVKAMKTTHHGFYLALILMPLIGWAIVSTSSSDAPFNLFQTIPWFKLEFLKSLGERQEIHEFFEEAHGILSWVILAMFALHVLAVIQHTWLKKDGALKRMLPWGNK